MRFCAAVVFLYIASGLCGQQIKVAGRADINIVASAADSNKVRVLLERETIKINPDVSSDVVAKNYDAYVQALPDLQTAIADKACAGKKCLESTRNQALLDTFVVTMQRKHYDRIEQQDMIDNVHQSSYVYVWSDPANAVFKMVQSGSLAWSDTTNKDRFLPQADYQLHIEMPGYESLDALCSNKRPDGVFCGGPLKKK